MIDDFMRGAGFFFKGLGFMGQKGLRRFVMLPLLVNITVFAAAIWFGFDYVSTYMQVLMHEYGSWLGILVVAVFILFVIVIGVFVFFTFSLGINLIASPFNGLLAARILRQTGIAVADAGNGLAGAIHAELGRWLYFALVLGPLALAALLITPLAPVLAPLSFIMAAWLLGLEYFAYPAELVGMDFRMMRKTLAGHRLFVLGFGAMTLTATLVPIVNFLVMPAAVAGAAAAWAARIEVAAGQVRVST